MKKLLNSKMLMLLGVAIIAGLAAAKLVPMEGLLLAGCFGVTTTDLSDGAAAIDWGRISRGGTVRTRITIPEALQVASDIVQVMKVKAGWLVKQVQLIMVTPTVGDAVAVNVGDGAGTSSYDAAVSLKGAAETETHGAPGTDAYLTAGGKYYTADDTIDFLFSTVTNPSGDIVVDVIAHVEDVYSEDLV